MKKIRDGPISADWDMDDHLVALKARMSPLKTMGVELLSSAIRAYNVFWPESQAPASVEELSRCLMACEERMDDWRSSAARVGADGEDTWLGDKPLSSQYPSLYRIAHRKEVTVASVLSPAPPINITFRRTLNGNRWNRWLQLLARLMEIQLNDNQDVFKWNLTASGKFTVKSLYLDYMSEHAHFNCKYLWKMKVPLKIKIFMWFLRRKVVLTKDNLAKRKWEGSKKVLFL